MEILGLNSQLKKDRIYSVYIEANGNEGYGSSDPYECWETEFCGKINCTKDVELTSDLLHDTLDFYWFNYQFTRVEFKDVTEQVKKLENLRNELDNFNWDIKSFEEWSELDDKFNELDNNTFPHFIGSIKLKKTI